MECILQKCQVLKPWKGIQEETQSNQHPLSKHGLCTALMCQAVISMSQSPSPQSCEACKQHHIHCMNEELAREV